MIWIRKRLKKPSIWFNLTFTNFNDSQEWKLESAINQCILKGTRIWLKTFQVQHYTHIYFAFPLTTKRRQNWGPGMCMSYLWLLCWSVTAHLKTKGHIWQRFSSITCNRAGQNAKQNIALPSSAYHVNLSAGVGIYDLSKNGGIDTELFLNLI